VQATDPFHHGLEAWNYVACDVHVLNLIPVVPFTTWEFGMVFERDGHVQILSMLLSFTIRKL
jgi:hypothetical protein